MVRFYVTNKVNSISHQNSKPKIELEERMVALIYLGVIILKRADELILKNMIYVKHVDGYKKAEIGTLKGLQCPRYRPRIENFKVIEKVIEESEKQLGRNFFSNHRNKKIGVWEMGLLKISNVILERYTATPQSKLDVAISSLVCGRV